VDTDEPNDDMDSLIAALMPRRQLLEMDWRRWYVGDDPVVRSVVSEALKHLGLKMFPDEDIETLRTTLPEYVNKMYEILDQTKDWPAVRQLGGSWEYDHDTGSVIDTGAPLDIDVVDHLMAISDLELEGWSVRDKQVWKDKYVELNLEHALMLLTLGEAKANRPGVAIKAFYVGTSLRAEEGYRRWRKQIGTAGKRSRLAGIVHQTEIWLDKNPKQTAKELWGKFPSFETPLRVDTSDGGIYHLNRYNAQDKDGKDTEMLIQEEVGVNAQEAMEQKAIERITFDSYRRYVTEAKKAMRKP